MRKVIIASTVLACLSASGQSFINVDLPAIDVGRYSNAGDHSSANMNYLTGRSGGVTYAGFAVFSVPKMGGSGQLRSTETKSVGVWQRRSDLDASPINPPTPLGPAYPYAWQWTGVRRTIQTTEKWVETITGGTLSLTFGNPGTTTSVGNTLLVNDVSTPDSRVLQGGIGKLDVYSDLSGGIQFGSAVPAAGPFAVSLNAFASAAFQTVAETGGHFALGFSLPGAQEGEYAFGFTGSAPIGLMLQGEVQVDHTDLPTEVVFWDSTRVPWLQQVGGSKLFDGDLWYTSSPDLEPDFIPVPEPVAAPLVLGLIALAYGLQRRIIGSRSVRGS